MIKNVLFIVLLLITQLAYTQSYINIGSTKSDVKKIQGEPTSIESYEEFGKEIWRYGEAGIATITFKNGKIKGFNNSNGILKIGDISKKPTKSEKPNSKKELWKELQEKANNYKPTEEPRKYGEDKSGMYGSSIQSGIRIPQRYAEMAEANGLSPYAMPDEIILQQMQKEYERKKYLKWGLIALGAIGILYLLFRIIIKKKHT